MFFASVESNAGEILNVQYPNGQIGGKALLLFWMGLQVYCSKSEEPEFKLFNELEVVSNGELCKVCQPFIKSICEETWSYQEDEYDFYLQRTTEPKLSLEEFLNKVSEYSDKWVDTNELFECIDLLITLFDKVKSEEDVLNEVHDLKNDFNALKETLKLLISRKAFEVRIRII